VEQDYNEAIADYLSWKDEYHLETRLLVVSKELDESEIRIAVKIGEL